MDVTHHTDTGNVLCDWP